MGSGSTGEGQVLRRPLDGAAQEWLWRHRIAIVSVLAAVAGLAVAYRSRPPVFLDDAAITARYAERIATGKGWTYNDGDRTNGASAPLYTMLLALLKVLGIETLEAIRYVVTAAYAASIGLVSYLAGRIAGILAAVLAAGLLLIWAAYRTDAISGMEGALGATLGLAVLVALLDDHETVAGVFLGLALVNKLDAVFLAGAVGLAIIVVRRRVPWRLAGISAAVLAPWILFSVAYFGAPLPRSATQKLGGAVNNPTWAYRPTWLLASFRDDRTVLLIVLAGAAILLLPWLWRRRQPAALVLAACVAWPLFHGLAFSLISLGDAYPWYRTVLYPPLAVAAAVAVVLIPERLAAGVHLPPLIARRVVPLVAAIGLVVVLQVVNNSPKTLVSTMRHGHTVTEYEGFEQQRRAAGAYLARVAAPGDVISTCWGWVAYEAIDHPIAETCPLSTRKPVGPARWEVPAMFPGTDPPKLEPGRRVVATFISTVGAGGRVDVVEVVSGPGSRVGH